MVAVTMLPAEGGFGGMGRKVAEWHVAVRTRG